MAAYPPMKSAGDWLFRLLLGGTFAYSAASKLLDPSAFAADIGHYHLLPHPLTLAAAVYLPWLELFCATAVLSCRFERGALLLLLGLCGLFSLALASAWWRGLDLTCGCFGGRTATTAPWALARSVVLALAAYYLLRISRQDVRS